MPTLQPGDLYVNRTLSNIAVKFQQGDNYIADKVFPTVPVQDMSGIFWKAPRGQHFRTDVQRRAPGAPAERISWGTETDSYLCNVDSVAIETPDEHRGNRTEWDIDRTNTELVTSHHMLRRELNWANKYFTSGVWDTNITGVASSPSTNQTLQWNETGSDPITFLQTQVIGMQERTGMKPNTLVLGPYAKMELLNHPLVLDRIKFTQTATPMSADNALASLLTVNRIVVAEAVLNSANEVDDSNPPTGDDGMHFVFGKAALLCYAAPNPSTQTPSAGYTFAHTGLYGASAYGMRVKKFRIENNGTDVIQGDAAYDQKVIASSLGAYFGSIVA